MLHVCILHLNIYIGFRQQNNSYSDSDSRQLSWDYGGRESDVDQQQQKQYSRTPVATATANKVPTNSKTDGYWRSSQEDDYYSQRQPSTEDWQYEERYRQGQGRSRDDEEMEDDYYDGSSSRRADSYDIDADR